MPWVNCSELICAARHSMPPLAGHSMKWMRDTDGKRTMSFMVSTSGRSTRPWIISRCCVRIDVGPSGMMALEEQAVRRDDAVQILQRRKADGGFRAGGEPRHVAPDDAGLGLGGPAIGPVDHAGADRLRPWRVGGRGRRRGIRRMAGLRAKREAAGQRRAEAEKAAPPQRRVARPQASERTGLLRNGSGRTFSSLRGRVAASFLAFLQAGIDIC